jgi:ankyrin repeat protein
LRSFRATAIHGSPITLSCVSPNKIILILNELPNETIFEFILHFTGIDVNALNLYGESALSTATYYNQILCVEYLLANKADPKL